jgi:hypothetical protein
MGAPGDLLLDLTPAEWTVLDAFEHPGYELVTVHPGGRAGQAWSYGFSETRDAPSWSMKSFAEEQLSEYLARCSRWRRRYNEGGEQRAKKKP